MASKSKTPSMAEVRKCLKDAGSYDAGMNDKEMLELYEVLQCSKVTATDEESRRSIIDDLYLNSEPVGQLEDDECTEGDEDVANSTTSPPVIVEKYKKLGLKKALQQSSSPTSSVTSEAQIEVDLDALNSVPTVHPPLQVIEQRSVYTGPIYCHSKLLNFNYKDRAHLIARYHLEQLEFYRRYQRSSLNEALWGKPVPSTQRFSGTLSRKPEDSNADTQVEDDPNQEEEELYISRSGRQTKRKLYKEDFKAGTPKKSKASTNKNGQGKKRQIVDEVKEPKTLDHNSNTLRRTDRVFQQLEHSDEKMKKEEKEIEKFVDSLDNNSDTENSDFVTTTTDSLNIDEQIFIRKVVPPPSYSKKVARRGGTFTRLRKNTKNLDSTSTAQKYSTFEVPNMSSDVQKAACPVCNEMFFQYELAEHASYCSELLSSQEYNGPEKPSSTSVMTLLCNYCDQVFMVSFEYEEHVRDCPQKPN